MRRWLIFPASFWIVLACVVDAGFGEQMPEQQIRPSESTTAGIIRPEKKLAMPGIFG
ncbi:MAG: hypothetical protein ACRENG_06500 [bacterium]